MKQRLSDAWRTPTDDNAEGVSTSDLPPDIAQLPLAQQHIYCAAYNQHMEENPDADDEECDQAGREAIAALGQDSSVFEAIRADAHKRYCDRVRDAWKST
jgi:cation transport regulator ChaB